MRRNRQFRVGDIMMILEVDRHFLMPFFRALELSGYLELEKSATDEFKDRHYKLLRSTGIHSPVVLKKPCDIVRDENTAEEFVLDGTHPLQVTDKIRLLQAMYKNPMTRSQIAKSAGMHPYSAKIFRYLDEFVEAGVMQRHERTGNARIYNIDRVKRLHMLRALGGAT
ncbi:MAG: hypothetical protein JXK05_03910 [Campylobacterales bacterium]|nr:hypothetical protein [Campylobacterales bacterium]